MAQGRQRIHEGGPAPGHERGGDPDERGDDDDRREREGIARPARRARSRGIALSDADRAPWLAAIHAQLTASNACGEDLVAACSSLKRSYRAVLSEGVDVTWVYLKGPAHLLQSRLQGRRGHHVTADLLPSQLDALEEPGDAIVADISQTPAAIVRDILAELRARQEA